MTEKNEIVMGFPLSYPKQQELAGAIAKCHAEKATHCVGVWCASTGFAVLVEVIDGTPVLYHMVGPVLKHHATSWFHGMLAEAEREGTGAMLQ